MLHILHNVHSYLQIHIYVVLGAVWTLQVHLDERAAANCGLPTTEVAFCAAQLVLALTALHKHGYLHRDVKPNNCMLRDDGYLVLADFGLCAGLRNEHCHCHYQYHYRYHY